MDFHVQLLALPAHLVWLVDNAHWRIHRHHPEELLDVLRIHPDASVRDLHADARGTIRAVNQVRTTGDIQSHCIVTERIVRPRWHRLGQRTSIGLVFLAN